MFIGCREKSAAVWGCGAAGHAPTLLHQSPRGSLMCTLLHAPGAWQPGGGEEAARGLLGGTAGREPLNGGTRLL